VNWSFHRERTLTYPGGEATSMESLSKAGVGDRNRTHFVSLKRRAHIHICQSRKFWWVTLESNQPGFA
jgi:hypothetical protein